MSETAITWNVTPFDAASCEKVAGHHDECDSDHLDRFCLLPTINQILIIFFPGIPWVSGVNAEHM